MKRYKVLYTERTVRAFIVEAEDEDEAITKTCCLDYDEELTEEMRCLDNEGYVVEELNDE